MTEPELRYLGPLDQPKPKPRSLLQVIGSIPWPFLVVVVLPTLATAIYYLMIVTPRYESEAHFIVRQGSSQQPSSLGVALQGVGLSAASTDSFTVHEYMMSRDALREINVQGAVTDAMTRPGVDFLSRRPRFWEDRSFEDLYKGFQNYLTVGYDSGTGISTIRVEAFSAQDAQKINAALLNGGEALVNRLNQRASNDAVEQGLKSVADAEARLAAAQTRLSGFRDREQFIDPELAAREASELIGTLAGTVATLRAEQSQLREEAPDSPQLPILDSRIRAYERQIAAERAKIVGQSTSISPRIGTFEALSLERELAAEAVKNANLALDVAQQESRRQQLYLERVVAPNMPDKPALPNRWLSILTIFLGSLIIYGLGWLVFAGVREHQQD